MTDEHQQLGEGWDKFQAALRRSNESVQPGDELRERVASDLRWRQQGERHLVVERSAWAFWPRVQGSAAIAAMLFVSAGLAWFAVPRADIHPEPDDVQLVASQNTDQHAIVVMADATSTIAREVPTANSNVTIVWMHFASVPPAPTDPTDDQSSRAPVPVPADATS